MTDNRPDDLAEWDAAYVLGALNPEDRRTYENYLATNPERSAELTGLTGMPDILNVLSPEEALALTDIAGSPPARIATTTSRRLRSGGGRAAAAIAARRPRSGGRGRRGAGDRRRRRGRDGFPRTTGSVQTVAMAPMQPGSRPGLTAQLAVTEKKWGTELNWACEYTKDWSRDVDSYDIVVTTKERRRRRPSAHGDRRATKPPGLSAATSVPTSEIRTVDIRVSGTDQPLAVTTL